MSQVRPGILIAIIVFATFAAYAYLAPATYRTSALLVVEPVTPGAAVKLPEPLEAGRRLGEAILDRTMLERLARERAASDTPEARAAAASQVHKSLEIDTSDAHTFSISYRDMDQARVQRACNDLAQHAAKLAPLVLADHRADFERDLTRQQQIQDLAGFLGLHPEAATETASPPGQPPDRDLALSAFHAEKANLEKRLIDLGNGRGSDNPYLEPRESDPTLLRRRLAEINSALAAHREALNAKVPGKSLTPELLAEWKRRLDAVTKTAAEAQQPAAAGLKARVATAALLPASPIDPNRTLLLFFGAVFGVGFGAAYALVARAAQQRRTKSSRPPAVAATQPLGVRVPPPPAVPSGLGPEVMSIPSRVAPPIVPIPQRQISSSPAPAPEQAPPPAPPANAERRPHSSNPPPPSGGRRFASTLVLPPAENPLASDPLADPALATAARGWDDEIRAHAVPGFAVVRPGSEPPARMGSSAPPAARVGSSAPSPATAAHAVPMNAPSAPQVAATSQPVTTATQPVTTATTASAAAPSPNTQRPASRPVNQMKVTQPLGSFVSEAGWNGRSVSADRDASPERLTSSTPPAPPRSPHPPRSPLPPGRSAGGDASVYSYVSKPAPPSEHDIVTVQVVSRDWAPDPRLVPAARRQLCAQLYPLAVQSCFVVGVVAVPESIEQKSRVAAELALALAESEHPRILLLEGDFHRPHVQRLMQVQMPMSGGFSQQLRARIDGSPASRWTVLSCTKTLHVLAEGFMRSPGLLLSQQFEDCMSDLRRFYDLIIIDGPTASLDVDSKAFDGIIDGLLTVCPERGSASLLRIQGLFGKKRLTAIAT